MFLKAITGSFLTPFRPYAHIAYCFPLPILIHINISSLETRILEDILNVAYVVVEPKFFATEYLHNIK